MISLIDLFVGIEIEDFMHLILFVLIDYNMPEQISKEFDYILPLQNKSTWYAKFYEYKFYAIDSGTITNYCGRFCKKSPCQY